MYRLIQGDVGSGKTIISLLTILDFIKSGFQCVIMVPTEVLAQQHLQYFKNYLSKLNIEIEILTSKTKKKSGNRNYRLHPKRGRRDQKNLKKNSNSQGRKYESWNKSFDVFN